MDERNDVGPGREDQGGDGVGIKVTVPATTANIGPGFDCLGIALSLYNTIEIKEIEEGLKIEVQGLKEDSIGLNENNLIYKSMDKIFKEVAYTPKGIFIRQINHIPPSRGLGSSAACIIGGLLGGNELCGNPFTKDDIFRMAVEMEGHPDNVAPALFGGFVVSGQHNGQTNYVKTPLKKNLRFLVGIPQQVLSTKKSREILPKEVLHKDAVFNVGNTALLVAALMSGDYEKLTNSIGDRLHQPYRVKLMGSLEEVFTESKNKNIDDIFLSGAGPSVIVLDWKEDTEKVKIFESVLQAAQDKWELKILTVDNKGAFINKNYSDGL